MLTFLCDFCSAEVCKGQQTRASRSAHINQQFYMDDFIQTYSSEGEARRSAQEIKTVLHTGGFNLTKFLSNKPAALENLLEEDKAEMKTQRILGLTRDPKTDKLMFAKPKLLYTWQQMTQRKVLSMAASLFDPVGLISPFAIRIRCILQRIIKEGRNWCQLVSECYQQELQEWMNELESMTLIQIPRCLIPNTNGIHQLHTFTDASMSAIAAIIYVRTTNADGSCTSQYVISKTKVASIKQLSIPKVELEAATLGAELAGFCESEMTTTITSKHFWTDSMATLGWIQSKRRQKKYIDNRLTKIHENSNPDNWRHIPGKMNPADHGTRGLTPSDIPNLWPQPPDFLSTPQDSWNFAEDSDPHICATQATHLQTPVIAVEKLSTWSRLLNSTRIVFQTIRRFKAKLRTRRQNESPGTSNTDNFASDENGARNYLIKTSQNEFFSGTISTLLKGSNLEKGDKLMPFTHFLDDIGLLRVGGRLNKAPQTYSAKHPLVLHSRSRIARLLIAWLWPSGQRACEGSPATDFPDDWVEKGAEKSAEILFHLQTMEGRQCETEYGRPAWIQIPICKQAVPLRQHRNGHVWTILHWGQERGHQVALRLLVHMPGHKSCPPRSVPWPLNRLSSHDHSQICLTTRIPWPHCEWQWQNLHWSQPSNEVEVPENLQARQRVHQTAIGSTEHSVDFQSSIGTTLRRSLGEADTDREKESTNSDGQSETKTLNFTDSCGGGRGNFELQAINSCGLQHLRWGTTYSESLPSSQTSYLFDTYCEQQPAVLH